MNAPSTVPEIMPADLKDRLDAGDVPLLVDVREPFEATIADLPERGQLRIPTGEFADRFEEIARDRDVVVYCRSGARSEWAAKVLLEHGYDRVWNLRGGILQWRVDVDPSVKAY
jgi:adenylyltransferase/sulfurtransferase